MMRYFVAVIACLTSIAPSTLAATSTLRDSSEARYATASPCTRETSPRLIPGRFSFPRDEGAHDGFESEWWRTFGSVADAAGRHYDFEINVARFALAGCRAQSKTISGRWFARHFIATSYELLDETSRAVERGTRVERESELGAKADSATLSIATGSLAYRDTGGGRRRRHFHLSLADRDNGLSLEQWPTRTPLPLGPGGIMQTGDCANCQAYAYAYTRNATHGAVRIAGVEHRISGSTWIEHEYAHRELGPRDVGWNRYELQFDDGRDLDVRFARGASGKFDVTAGTFVAANGKITYLHADDARVQNTMQTKWRSLSSGVTYPSLWYLVVPSKRLELATVEIAFDQESRDELRTPYLAAAVVVERAGPPGGDRGHGFVELTGYGAPVSL